MGDLTAMRRGELRREHGDEIVRMIGAFFAGNGRYPSRYEIARETGFPMWKVDAIVDRTWLDGRLRTYAVHLDDRRKSHAAFVAEYACHVSACLARGMSVCSTASYIGISQSSCYCIIREVGIGVGAERAWSGDQVRDIVERRDAGESIMEIAADYGCDVRHIVSAMASSVTASERGPWGVHAKTALMMIADGVSFPDVARAFGRSTKAVERLVSKHRRLAREA